MKIKEVNLQVAVANKNVVTLQDIEASIIRITGLDMKQRSRGRAYVNARALFYYLAYKYTACNISEIARHAGMNHASVIHHLKHAPYTIPQDPEMQVWYDYITAYLNELVHSKNLDPTEKGGVDTMNVLEKVEYLLEKIQKLELELQSLKYMYSRTKNHEQEI